MWSGAKKFSTFGVYSGVFVAALLFFSIGLGAASRSKGAERYFLLSGFTMAQSGDWITPVYEGVPRFQKPPMAYWMIAASYKIFGVHLWSGRLPSAVAGAMGVMLTGLMGEWLFRSRRAGLLAALFLSTCTGYLIQSRMAVTDIFLLLFFLITMMFYARELFFPEGSELRRVGMWASMALAFLAKGHLGVVMPFMIAVGLGVQRGFSLKRTLRPWVSPLGWLIFLLLASPWFLAMGWIHGSAFYHHLLASETERRVGFSLLNFGWNAALYTKNWFLYFFPTTWILTVGLMDRKGAAGGTDEMEQKIVRFLWTWVAAVLFLFVVLVYDFQSGYYLVPMTPSLALLAAFYGIRSQGKAYGLRLWHGFFKIMLFLTAIMFIAAGAASLAMAWWSVRAFLVNIALMAVPAAGGLKLRKYLRSFRWAAPELWKPMSTMAATFGALLIVIIGLWEPIAREPEIVRMMEASGAKPGLADRLYAVGINERDRSWLVVFSQHRIDRSFSGPSAVEEANHILLREFRDWRLESRDSPGRLFLVIHREDFPGLEEELRNGFEVVGEGCQWDTAKIRQKLRFYEVFTGNLRPGDASLQRCVMRLVSKPVSP